MDLDWMKNLPPPKDVGQERMLETMQEMQEKILESMLQPGNRRDIPVSQFPVGSFDSPIQLVPVGQSNVAVFG